MHPAQWYLDGNARVTDKEWKDFEAATWHLPVREDSTPYHSGVQSMRQIYHALRITNPPAGFTVLEVGFCLGHSASIFFYLGASKVVSIENSERAQTMQAKKIMEDNFGDRFVFLRPNEPIPNHPKIDFGFIDGDHGYEAISNDYGLMRSHNVPWILFDDYWPHWGDTQQVMKNQGIAPIAILGTMALCKL